MARYLARDRIAIAAALSAPLTVAAVLIELRTFGNGQYYGWFMLKAKPGSRPSRQARLVTVTLAGQAGRAFGASQTARSMP